MTRPDIIPRLTTQTIVYGRSGNSPEHDNLLPLLRGRMWTAEQSSSVVMLNLSAAFLTKLVFVL